MFDTGLDVDDMIRLHKEMGDEKLAENLQYILEHKDEWREGEVRPEHLPNFEYDVNLVIMNCIAFGDKWNDE